MNSVVANLFPASISREEARQDAPPRFCLMDTRLRFNAGLPPKSSGAKLRTILLALSVLCTSQGERLLAQSKIMVDYEGEMYRMHEYRSGSPYVSVDGRLRKATDERRVVGHADAYGEGRVTVTVLKEEMNRPGETGSRRKVADDLFQFEAEVVADRDLGKCFGLLPAVSSGSPILYFVSVGNISKGVSKKVRVRSGDVVHGVGTLRIFSGGEEIENETVSGLGIMEEIERMQKASDGVPALALADTEPLYPHLLSNDGQVLLTFRDRDTHLSLIVFDLVARTIVYDVEIEGHDNWIRQLDWLNDDEAIFVLAYRNAQKKVLRDLYSYRLGEKEARLLRKSVWGIYRTNLKDADTIIVQSNIDGDLFTYNCRTKKAGKDKKLGYGFNLFDSDGNARIVLQDDRDRSVFKYRETSGGPWKRLDSLNQEPGLKFNFRADSVLEQQVFLKSFSPERDKVYLFTNHRDGTYDLALYDLNTGLIEKVLYSSKKYDLGGFDVASVQLLYEKESEEVTGLVWYAEKPSVTWFKERFIRNQETFDGIFPNSVNIPLDWTDNGTVMIYYSYNEQTPGKVYIYMPDRAEIIPIYDLGPQLADKELGKTAVYTFKARDGYPLDAYFTLPPGYSEEKVPLIVLPHGGPTMRDIWGYDPLVQYFATRGYGVLQVNYRGSSGYGVEHMKQGLEGELGGVVIDDIADGARHLIEAGVADPERVAITGGSFGGYCTYMSLLNYPELYKVGVAVAGVSHWGKLIKGKREYDFAFSFWNEILSRSSEEDYVRKISPYFRAHEFTRPIKIIHGEDDDIVPVSQARMMERALKEAGKEVELSVFDNVGHTVYSGLLTQRYGVLGTIRRMEEIEAFIEKHLP